MQHAKTDTSRCAHAIPSRADFEPIARPVYRRMTAQKQRCCMLHAGSCIRKLHAAVACCNLQAASCIVANTLHVATCKLQAALLQTRCKVSEYCVLGVSMRTVSPGKALCMLLLHVVAQVMLHQARFTLHVACCCPGFMLHIARCTLQLAGLVWSNLHDPRRHIRAAQQRHTPDQVDVVLVPEQHSRV